MIFVYTPWLYYNGHASLVTMVVTYICRASRMRPAQLSEWWGSKTSGPLRHLIALAQCVRFFSPIFLFITCGCVVHVYETQPMRNSVVF